VAVLLGSGMMKKIEVDYREAAIENLPYRLAIDDVGIYAAAVTGGKNPYEKRTERMEGHNEAIMGIAKKASQIADFIRKHQYRTEIEDALLKDWIHIDADETIKLYVNCNDVFWWACADSEEIKPEEIKGLQECVELSKAYGTILWACRKRGMRPQSPWFEDLSKEELKLFKACGPKRDKKDEG